MAILIVTLILALALILLITEALPLDLTAIGIMVVLALTGILSPAEAVAGFANPAVITVAAMFLISRGLIRTGAVGFIAQRVIASARGNTHIAILVVLIIVAVASAFINNTPVVVLFIPIVLSLSCTFDFSPSRFLIPVSYASILAGTCTLIGTSTNIIVSDLSVMYGQKPIGMFELAAAGVPIAVVGIAFLFLVAPRLMPAHAAPTCEIHGSSDRRYLAELVVLPGSVWVGRDPYRAMAEKYPSLELFEVIRGTHIQYPDEEAIRLRANDLLLVKGSANDIIAVLNDKQVEVPKEQGVAPKTGFNREELIVELILPPQSRLPGQKLLESHLSRYEDIQVIAIKRRRLHYTAQMLRHLILRVGDILLVKCHASRLERIRSESELIIVEDVHHEIVHKRKAPIAFAIFAAVVAAATSGMADIMVCAMAGVILMIFSGCLQLRDAYKALQANVLVLIVGTIALGLAMEKTGTAKWFAEVYLALFKGADPRLVLAGIILMTSIGTQLLNNNATAVLFLPIALSTAASLGVDPRPFIIAICFGASACFASPIGYQTNLLVYGPGSYRFGDYLKLGIPLNLLVIAAASYLIPIFWPL